MARVEAAEATLSIGVKVTPIYLVDQLLLLLRSSTFICETMAKVEASMWARERKPSRRPCGSRGRLIRRASALGVSPGLSGGRLHDEGEGCVRGSHDEVDDGGHRHLGGVPDEVRVLGERSAGGHVARRVGGAHVLPKARPARVSSRPGQPLLQALPLLQVLPGTLSARLGFEPSVAYHGGEQQLRHLHDEEGGGGAVLLVQVAAAVPPHQRVAGVLQRHRAPG
eukprot:scaffold54858_cov51-Phaeocystis_antarctica.AAC.4